MQTQYSFNINGLTIGNQSFCPLATCQLLQDGGHIEMWMQDLNGEPIILFSKEIEDGEGNWDTATGFCLWCDFVRTFLLSSSDLSSLYSQIILQDSLINTAIPYYAAENEEIEEYPMAAAA